MSQPTLWDLAGTQLQKPAVLQFAGLGLGFPAKARQDWQQPSLHRC